jgi:O-antigen biosynthesis protein
MPDSYWNDLARHTELDEIWMSHPLARARINERISGRADVWPTGWLRERIGRRPIRRALSIGCGIGNLERDLARQEIVERCVGVDTAPRCIDEARSRASSEGLADRLEYTVADAWEALSQATDLDAVFFHGSLHHFRGHDELLWRVASALAPGGILYLDEYVGPSRDEWRARNLILPNVIYRLLPSPVRRARLVRAPINRDDPTEAVESSRILPALSRAFSRVERRDYGGNLLSLLYPNLNRPPAGSPGRDAFNEAVSFLLDLEDVALKHQSLLGVGTWFTVAIARKDG